RGDVAGEQGPRDGGPADRQRPVQLHPRAIASKRPVGIDEQVDGFCPPVESSETASRQGGRAVSEGGHDSLEFPRRGGVAQGAVEPRDRRAVGVELEREQAAAVAEPDWPQEQESDRPGDPWEVSRSVPPHECPPTRVRGGIARPPITEWFET